MPKQFRITKLQNIIIHSYPKYLGRQIHRMHDCHIYNKVVDWFAVIEKELASPVVLPENTTHRGAVHWSLQ
jgi:thymidylate synthase